MYQRRLWIRFKFKICSFIITSVPRASVKGVPVHRSNNQSNTEVKKHKQFFPCSCVSTAAFSRSHATLNTFGAKGLKQVQTIFMTDSVQLGGKLVHSKQGATADTRTQGIQQNWKINQRSVRVSPESKWVTRLCFPHCALLKIPSYCLINQVCALTVSLTVTGHTWLPHSTGSESQSVTKHPHALSLSAPTFNMTSSLVFFSFFLSLFVNCSSVT